MGAEKKIVKIRFRLFYDKKRRQKKVLWPLSPRGGVRPYWPGIKRRIFFAASLTITMVELGSNGVVK